jgi:EAL domain-containing protein (putative c-di-GMP-specific phosphodiesterase class I)
MPEAARYLGFAFASADLLFEIGAGERVTYAIGASRRVLGCRHEELVGRALDELIAEDDLPVVVAVLEGLKPGARRGPVRVELRRPTVESPRRFAGFYACRLLQDEATVSCALSLSPVFGARAEARDRYGLLDRDGFMAATGRLLEEAHEGGFELDLQLVDVPGLAKAQEGRDALLSRVAAALRVEACGGEGAGRVGGGQFVVLREGGTELGSLAERIERVGADANISLEPLVATVALDDQVAPLATLRALRVAVERLQQGGVADAEAAFASVLKSTVEEAAYLAAVVSGHRFDMAYQPVVEIATQELSHYEALLRFEHGRGPAQSIQLAEELDIIADLDLAVLDRVIAKLMSKGCNSLRVAANVSGRSLMSPQFMERALQRLQSVAWLTDRLSLEITETAALVDLDKANAAIQRLRRAGCAVYLDDFGSGAATMDYLRALTVDAVKIDGRYISDLATSERSRLLVRHIAELCRDFGIATVAEHVEDQAIAEVLGTLGVRLGQGWLYGRPMAKPAYAPPNAAPIRRLGERAARA